MGRPLINLTNKKFGHWKVIKHWDIYPPCFHRWLCLCSCGNKKAVFGFSLRNGESRSCGHARTKHGHTIDGKSPTYRSWDKMIQRCTNSKTHQYKDYGGRDIKVCKRWLDFKNFLDDMGEKPKGLSLDRVNVYQGYKPSNCKWSTRSEQARNRRPQLAIESFSTAILKAELKRREEN